MRMILRGAKRTEDVQKNKSYRLLQPGRAMGFCGDGARKDIGWTTVCIYAYIDAGLSVTNVRFTSYGADAPHHRWAYFCAPRRLR